MESPLPSPAPRALQATAARIAAVKPAPRTTTEVAENAAVQRWLIASAIAVIVALVVGGLTRLTEAGLAITEWRPVSGVVPPLTAADWDAAYRSYLRIPEARSVHLGITLDQFRGLFWWEWVHRLLARVVGLVIAVPFFVLLLRGRIRPHLQLRLANLPILVAAQGVLGWYMVQSGLTERTDVSQYRLVAHLGVAMLIYVIAAWTAMTAARDDTRLALIRPMDPGAVGVASLALLTLLSGGFVAGLDGGEVYNTFPMMGDGVFPREYWTVAHGWWNWFENPVAAQFNHRVLAIGTLGTVLAFWWQRGSQHRRWRLVGVAALGQVTLGIATLVFSVPLALAALHQVGAVALLTAALWVCAGSDEDGASSRAEPQDT